MLLTCVLVCPTETDSTDDRAQPVRVCAGQMTPRAPATPRGHMRANHPDGPRRRQHRPPVSARARAGAESFRKTETFPPERPDKSPPRENSPRSLDDLSV